MSAATCFLEVPIRPLLSFVPLLILTPTGPIAGVVPKAVPHREASNYVKSFRPPSRHRGRHSRPGLTLSCCSRSWSVTTYVNGVRRFWSGRNFSLTSLLLPVRDVVRAWFRGAAVAVVPPMLIGRYSSSGSTRTGSSVSRSGRGSSICRPSLSGHQIGASSHRRSGVTYGLHSVYSGAPPTVARLGVWTRSPMRAVGRPDVARVVSSPHSYLTLSKFAVRRSTEHRLRRPDN